MKRKQNKNVPISIMEHRMPAQVKIISVLIIVFSFWIIINSLIETIKVYNEGVLGDLTDNQIAEYKLRFENRGMEFNEDSLKLFYLVGFVIILLMSLFFILLAIKLWQGRNWARIIVIIFSFIFTAFDFISILFGSISGTIKFLIGLAISLYLLLDKKVYVVFKIKR